MRAAVWMLSVIASSALVAACPPPRDVVPDTHDVRGQPDATAPQEGYAYVVRRPHGVVGLVGSRNMRDEDAHRFSDRIADELEACARRLEAEGALAEGAASLVIVATNRGAPEVNDLRVASGPGVAKTALLCLIAPIRSMNFVPGEASSMGVEVTWGPGRGTAPHDAGAIGPGGDL